MSNTIKPLPGLIIDQEGTNEPVPPESEMIELPLPKPKQVTWVLISVIPIVSGSFTSSLKAATHPVERSLIMTEYVPGPKPDKSSTSSLSPTPSISQSTVYELVPETVKSNSPLLFPLQSTSVTTIESVGALALAIGKTADFEQLLSSVTVT